MNEKMEQIINDYLAFLKGKSPATRDVYGRVLVQMSQWMANLPGSPGPFQLQQLTRTALAAYLDELESQGYSASHRKRVKAVISSFARWAIDEKRGGLTRNPVRDIRIKDNDEVSPRQLDADQRLILKTLVEREASVRGEAIFGLGYWAGCRVSDISWLRLEDCHIGPKIGWIKVGYKGGKKREIDLLNEVRRPVYHYVHSAVRDEHSPYLFTSQRQERLTEAGIHHWFRQLKNLATHSEWLLIEDVTFHDLRHDFAHRARQADWRIEEIAYYLGHSMGQGIPNLQTTARYIQVNRHTVKDKLQTVKG